MMTTRELKIVTREGELASTNTTDTVAIVFVETTVQCCPTQSEWTTDETSISMWDTSGSGDWQLWPLGQCGGCGRTIEPTAFLLPNFASDEARWLMAMSHCDRCGVAGEAVRNFEGERVCEPCWECNWAHPDDEDGEWRDLPPVQEPDAVG